MNKSLVASTLSAIGVGVIAGVVIYKRRQRKRGRKVPSEPIITGTPKAQSSSDNRVTHQDVTVTKEPSDLTDSLYKHFTDLKSLLDISSDDEVIKARMNYLTTRLMNENRLVYLALKQRSISEVIERVVVSPETFLGEAYLKPLNGGERRTALYAIRDDNQSTRVILVQFDELIFSIGMHDEDTFVATGPKLEQANTMGYLEVLLEIVTAELEIE